MLIIPAAIDRSKLRLGVPGTATVFAENAGVIGLLMPILVWISSYDRKDDESSASQHTEVRAEA